MSGTTTTPVINLECCCCGGGCRGRQWHNRDDDYGICGGCIEYMRGRGTPESELTDLYGREGVHWNIQE